MVNIKSWPEDHLVASYFTQARGSVNATSSPPPARLRSTLAIAAALLIVSALLATCLGAEIMQHIAAPMVGDMLTAPPLSMLVIPAAYPLMPRRALPALSHV